jgi:TPR repeat protein
VLGAEAAAARAEEKAAASRAAEATEDRARIEKLDAATLRLELDRRGALAGLPAGASREALIAARLCAPAPTPETLSAAAEREDRASLLRRCRLCELLMPEEPASAGRCAACKRVRYCGVACQKADWPRHKPECKAWKDAEVVASGGCPLGDLKAQEAAIMMWNAPERTLAEIRKAAEGGDLAAQYMLGNCFDIGDKVSAKDAAEAVKWWRCSAAGNVALAQYSLGCSYHGGQGVSCDLSEAARLFALSAAQGHARAQFNLGSLFRDGKGVAVDLAEAARLFRLSAEQGHAKAQAALASTYIFGRGVVRDYALAMVWARRAADQGNAFGEHIVGVLYGNGWGVPRSFAAAVPWFERAVKHGRTESKQTLLNLAEDGVPEAVAAVRRLRLAPPP